MSTPALGAGACPAGSCPAGYGLPATADVIAIANFKKADGSQGNAPLLTPQGDFVLDAAGQKQGADSVPMMVQLALFTTFNSSAVRGLGLDLSGARVLTTQTAAVVDKAVRAAVKHLTDRKLISVQSVTTDRLATSAISITVKWVDLNTGELNTTSYTPGLS